MALLSPKFEPPKPQPPVTFKPAAKPAAAAPAPVPAPAPAPQSSSIDRTASTARAMMLVRLGAPDAPPPVRKATTTTAATTLLNEDIRDGSRNCLDAVGDWLSMASPQIRARSEVLILSDTRGGAEGSTGHVVIRQGDSVFDPMTGKTYPSFQDFNADGRYQIAQVVGGSTMNKILNTPPNSPERQQALDAAHLSPRVQGMLLADGPQVGQTVYSQTRLNVRGDPSTGNAPLRTLDPGTPMVVAGPASNGWVPVTIPPSADVVYVSASYVDAQPPVSATGGASGVSGAPAVGGPRNGLVQTNYTDIGMVWTPEGMRWDPTEAAADLDRLRAAGITDVRVWAPVAGLNDPVAMANRVDALATMAAERGMTLTVDIFDGHGNAQLQNYLDAEPVIRERISTIIGQNKGHSNIVWSLGNEMQAPDRPAEFGSWYAGMVGEMRAAARPNHIRVSAELVPRAAGDPNDPATRAAMAQIVRAVDVVSIHLYPNVPVEGVENSSYAMEYSAFREWMALADQSGKGFRVGEFAMDQGPARDAANLDSWLRHLEGLGVDSVLLWQFMKNEAGHIDGVSYDSVDGNSFEAELRQGGWIN